MDDATKQLEQQYIETSPALRAYFRRRNATATTADDLLQETFLRAWKQRARLQEAASPRAYLFGIARHVSLDAHRRARPMEPLDWDPASEEAEPLDERLDIVRAAIAALPAIHREALRLKLQDELSYAEIADVLGIPLGTVRSRLHHAIQQLQASLNSNPASQPSTENAHET